MNTINFRHPEGYVKFINQFSKFKEFIAKQYETDQSYVIPTCGATGALHAIFSAIALKEYSENNIPKALIHIPEYFDAFLILKKLNYNIKTIESKDYYTINIDNIIEISKKEQASLIYLSIPNNPTGKNLSYQDLRKLISSINNETYIVIDKSLSYSKKELDLKELYKEFKHKNLIIIYSFSKSQGLIEDRIGYLISTKSEILQRIHPYVHAPASNSIKKAISSSKKKYEQKILDKIKKSDKKLKELSKKYPKIKYHNSESNFALLEISDERSAYSIRNQLKEKGIIIVSSEDLFIPKAKYLRISMELPEKLDNLFKEINNCK